MPFESKVPNQKIMCPFNIWEVVFQETRPMCLSKRQNLKIFEKIVVPLQVMLYTSCDNVTLFLCCREEGYVITTVIQA